MSTFYVLTYILSLIIAFCTVIAAICVAFYRPLILHTLPRALRLYITVCYIPIVIIVAIFTAYYATNFLINENEYLPVLYVINMINSYLNQILRTFVVILALERIVAAIYIENYTISNKVWFAWILILFTVVIAVIFMIIVFSVVSDMGLTFVLYTYTVFGMHVTALIVITVLYYLNQKMYKITAYRITLKKRYQIAENLKILAYIFPLILIYTLLAPMGSVITLIGIHFNLPHLPFSILHGFHNLPHLIICLRLIFINFKKHKNSNVTNDIVVKNVLGKSLSTVVNSDTYFKELKNLWK